MDKQDSMQTMPIRHFKIINPKYHDPDEIENGGILVPADSELVSIETNGLFFLIDTSLNLVSVKSSQGECLRIDHGEGENIFVPVGHDSADEPLLAKTNKKEGMLSVTILRRRNYGPAL